MSNKKKLYKKISNRVKGILWPPFSELELLTLSYLIFLLASENIFIWARKAILYPRITLDLFHSQLQNFLFVDLITQLEIIFSYVFILCVVIGIGYMLLKLAVAKKK